MSWTFQGFLEMWVILFLYKFGLKVEQQTENYMNENVTIRITRRSKPLFDKVKTLADTQPVGRNMFAPMLLDIIELGLQSYESGNRVLGNEVLPLKSVFETGERSRYSVFNEVVESLYSSLAGAIANLGYYEKSKQNPDPRILNYYRLIGKALWAEKSNFPNLTDEEIKEVANELSPIKKQLFGDKDAQQLVIENNRAYFDMLISKNGIK